MMDHSRDRKKSGLRREADRLQRLMAEAGRLSSNKGVARRMLSFFLEDRVFALPLDALEEVISPPTLSRVPTSRDEVLGVASVRGEVVPVLDLRRMAGYSSSLSPSDRARVLLVGGRAERVGFLVDSVAEVESWSEGDLLKIGEDPTVPLLGRVNVRGTDVYLIDLPQLMDQLRDS